MTRSSHKWETVEERGVDGEHEWRDCWLVRRRRDNDKGIVHIFIIAGAIGVESTYLYYVGTRVCIICEYTYHSNV